MSKIDRARRSFILEAFGKDEYGFSVRRVGKCLESLQKDIPVPCSAPDSLEKFYSSHGISVPEKKIKKHSFRFLPAVSCAGTLAVLLLVVIIPGLTKKKNEAVQPTQEAEMLFEESLFDLTPQSCLPYGTETPSDKDEPYIEADHTGSSHKTADAFEIRHYLFTDSDFQTVSFPEIGSSKMLTFLNAYEAHYFSEGAASGYKLILEEGGIYYYIDLTQEMLDYLTD